MPRTQAAEPLDEARRFTVLYDADCGFCTATMRWLARRDRHGRLTFLPLQAAISSDRPRIREIARSHDLSAALHVVDEQSGRVDAGAPAVMAVLGVLPRWSIVARLASVGPARLASDLVYRAVARHRDRVGRVLGVGGAGCATAHGPGSRPA